jgi:carbon storage regulator
MLIITRQFGERIMIGDHTTVTVLGVKAHTVRLGIEAPRDVAVHREEVFERIKAGVSSESRMKPARPPNSQND